MKRSSIILFGLVAIILGLVLFELFGSSGASKEAPRCGDGRLNALNEQCDDGNQNEMDACNNKCQRTKDLCGNGKVEGPLEECDDGNNMNNDGCDKNCKREEKWGICGNGIKEPSEECDDGNKQEFDGCNSLCRKVVIAGGASPELCGNGKLDEGEGCDDGNNVNGDGCSFNCMVTDNGAWYTKSCNKCMKERCGEISDACLNDSSCEDALACSIKNACLSPSVGPMTCYCGNISIMDCKDNSPPMGPCVRETERDLGVAGKNAVFDNYLNEDKAMGRANRALVCLAGECYEECPTLFGGPSTVKR